MSINPPIPAPISTPISRVFQDSETRNQLAQQIIQTVSQNQEHLTPIDLLNVQDSLNALQDQINRTMLQTLFR
jgi:hypothetical protein